MNKTASIIISIGVIICLGFIFFGNSKSKINSNNAVANSVIKDGVQYITIDAKGGYTPVLSTAKAGIPTKLIVKTAGTFDCSAALAIHSINYQKILPQTGDETIDIGVPKAGVPLEGVCGMGMYSFKINFE